MEYFHKDLCHLLSINLSNLTLKAAKAAAAKAAAEAAVAAVAAGASPNQSVAMRNDKFPVSLLFRANIFKDGFKLPPRVNCLKLISDLNWNTAPLKWYAEITLGQLEHKLPLQDLLLHLCGPE